MAAVRMALLTVRLVTRTKVALFFTLVFPMIFLFVYAGLFARGNPQAVAYVFGPVITLNIMASGFWGLGLQSVVQRERGSLRRYRLAPIGAGTIVTSNLLANYLLQLPTIGLLTFCAVVFFHMPLKIGWLTLLILVTVGAFAFAGFGLIIASVANTMQEAQVYNNVAWLTLLFLSGATIPLPLLPHWVQRLAAFLPATYLVSSFQAIMVQSQALSRHSPEMLALIFGGTLGLLIAWKLFRWEKEERIATRGKLWCLAFLLPFLTIGFWMNARANPTAGWAMTYSLIERGVPRSGGEKEVPGRLIEGFESPQAQEELLKRWTISKDSLSTGGSVAELSIVSPGANGTRHALRLHGRLGDSSPAQGFVMASFNLTAPPKLNGLPTNAFPGIEFFIRSDDSRLYQISLRRQGAAPEANPEIRFVPSRDWQPIRLPGAWWADSGGSAGGNTPLRFQVLTSGGTGDFSVEIDEIRFSQ